MNNPDRAGERLLRLELEADADRLREIRAKVAEVTDKEGFGPKVCDQLVLAIDEACSNVIRHGYGHRKGELIILEIFRNHSELTFVLEDFAERVESSKIRPRSLEKVRPGGLGINLIDQIMDSWEFIQPEGGVGNLLVMKKQLPEKTKTTHVKV